MSPGPFGQAIKMTGNQYISAPYVGSLTSWTDSVWINIPAANITNNQCLLSARFGSYDMCGFDIYYLPAGKGGSNPIWPVDPVPANCIFTEITSLNNKSLPIGQDWLYYGTIPVTLSPNSWHMITSTVTTGQYNLYVDGTLVSSVAMNSRQSPLFMNPEATLSIGGGPFGAYVTGFPGRVRSL